MKRILILLLFIHATGAVFASDNTRPFFQPIQPARPLQVMAHRGAADAAPENTRPALELAARMGFEWAEIDVRLTKDGKHVIFHDTEVDGKTDGTGAVKNLTLDEIKRLDAGAWFASRFAGTRVLTFDELLNFAKGKINLYIDCKDVDPELLVEEITRRNMQNQVAVYDSWERLKLFRKLSNGSIPLMAKCHNLDELKTLVDEIQTAIVEINYGDLTQELVDAAHRAGSLVQVKVLDATDNPNAWKDAIQKGVDFLQSDCSDLVQGVFFHHKVERAPCWISAHRGFGALRPENTLPAFQKAIDLGCDFVEIDVRTSSDGKLVLMHDSKTDRTTSLQGKLSGFPFDVLRGVSAGAWFGKPYAEEKIPTLAEALQLAKGRINIYLDNKQTDPLQLVNELERFDMGGAVVIYDGDLDALANIREINPSIKLMPPYESDADIKKLSERLHPYAVDARWGSLSADTISQCHSLGIKVFSDAMGLHENVEDYRQAIEWGIDLIQTDNPLMVQRAMEIE